MFITVSGPLTSMKPDPSKTTYKSNFELLCGISFNKSPTWMLRQQNSRFYHWPVCFPRNFTIEITQPTGFPSTENPPSPPPPSPPPQKRFPATEKFQFQIISPSLGLPTKRIFLTMLPSLGTPPTPQQSNTPFPEFWISQFLKPPKDFFSEAVFRIHDILVWIRILLFLSSTFKMQTKN